MNHIFLIDDEKMLNIIHTKVLRQIGYEHKITVFNNAAAALSQIGELMIAHRDELPEVIFLDLQMPGMDGWKFLQDFERLILPLPHTCKVYILSATINETKIIRAKSHASVEDLIHKPLTIDKLKRLLAI